MAFDWASTAVSVGSSLLGGMGGSKEAERDAQDAAALANYRTDAAVAKARADVRPFIETGTQANRLLAQYLGIDTSGYNVPKPTLERAINELRAEHFKNFGTDYGRNSDVGGQMAQAERRYAWQLKQWERGLERWKKENPGRMGDGSLLKPFTNEDFVKDPGYEFRLAEGEKGIDRALAARGGYDSGAALKALGRYNQGFASNEFDNAYNRDNVNKNRIYTMLSGQSAQGLGAATNAGNMAFTAAQQQGQIGMNNANTMLAQSNQRADNWANALTAGATNALYGIRSGNQSVVSAGRTPPFNPGVGTPGINLSGYTPWG